MYALMHVHISLHPETHLAPMTCIIVLAYMDMCIGMCMGMCFNMCTGMCTRMYADMYADMCAHVCADVWADAYVCRCRHVRRHVCSCAHAHARGHMHGMIGKQKLVRARLFAFTCTTVRMSACLQTCICLQTSMSASCTPTYASVYTCKHSSPCAIDVTTTNMP